MPKLVETPPKTEWVAARTLAFASGFFLFWWAIAQWTRQLDGALGVVLPPASRGAGLALMALGAAIAVSCVLLFVFTGDGTPAPFDAPRKFVAAGAYRVSRNPMYVGLLLLLSGLGLWWRSMAVLLLVVAVALLVEGLVVGWEEPHLRAQFGDSYRSYCARVPRWVPMWAKRGLLMAALLFLAGTALWGGTALLLEAHGNPWGVMPQSLLKHSPFHSYLIPGVVLLAANGLLAVWVLWRVAARRPRYGLWGALQGFVLLGWLTTECLMVRTVIWPHYLYGGVALVLIATGFGLRD